MEEKKSLDSHEYSIDDELDSLPSHEVDVHVNMDTEMEIVGFGGPTFNHTENTSTKRRRGRPKGSGKLQVLASIGGYFGETAGGKFYPHVMIVATGEDIRAKIFSLCESAQQTVVVLSATGTVSNVVLGPTISLAEVSFQGEFEILSLSGSFTHDKVDGKKRLMGILSISLAKPDGQVFGGSVGGPLIVATTPVQVRPYLFISTILRINQSLRYQHELFLQLTELIVGLFKQNILMEYNKRQSKSNKLGDLQIVRVSMDTTDEDENSTALTGPAASHSIGENALQILQPPVPYLRTSPEAETGASPEHR
ncbi:hypothetical protein Dsin_019853 [Dipteronia sinensis]|uniref:AT-hook motif nuclear-localized protein n=1 Tax=Dipteronia sinensis TaxID=43782 RepID=A0AAE0A8J3_9ROSI|nr:hypothetical protein Dsin_019853 [Dipteronia sinensis]